MQTSHGVHGRGGQPWLHVTRLVAVVPVTAAAAAAIAAAADRRKNPQQIKEAKGKAIDTEPNKTQSDSDDKASTKSSEGQGKPQVERRLSLKTIQA